jgi:hypothetical protein
MRPSCRVALAVFTAFLWTARFDRRGPWYFLALASAVAAVAIALRRDPGQN